MRSTRNTAVCRKKKIYIDPIRPHVLLFNPILCFQCITRQTGGAMDDPVGPTGDRALSSVVVSPSAAVDLYPAQLDADEKLAWIVAFGLLLAVATVGNSLVTWFIIGKCDYSINSSALLQFFPFFLPCSSSPIGQGLQLLHAEPHNGRFRHAIPRVRLQLHLHSRRVGINIYSWAMPVQHGVYEC